MITLATAGEVDATGLLFCRVLCRWLGSNQLDFSKSSLILQIFEQPTKDISMKKIIQFLFSTKITEKRTSIALLVFRVLLSLSLFNTHGLKKILHFEETLAHIPDPFGFGSELSTYIALFANLVCPVFVVLGLFTRVAILPIVGITLSGFFIVHASDPWSVKDIPLMYSMSFLLLLYLGPGTYALDKKLFKKQ